MSDGAEVQQEGRDLGRRDKGENRQGTKETERPLEDGERQMFLGRTGEEERC